MGVRRVVRRARLFAAAALVGTFGLLAYGQASAGETPSFNVTPSALQSGQYTFSAVPAGGVPDAIAVGGGVDSMGMPYPAGSGANGGLANVYDYPLATFPSISSPLSGIGTLTQAAGNNNGSGFITSGPGQLQPSDGISFMGESTGLSITIRYAANFYGATSTGPNSVTLATSTSTSAVNIATGGSLSGWVLPSFSTNNPSAKFGLTTGSSLSNAQQNLQQLTNSISLNLNGPITLNNTTATFNTSVLHQGINYSANAPDQSGITLSGDVRLGYAAVCVSGQIWMVGESSEGYIQVSDLVAAAQGNDASADGNNSVNYADVGPLWMYVNAGPSITIQALKGSTSPPTAPAGTVLTATNGGTGAKGGGGTTVSYPGTLSPVVCGDSRNPQVAVYDSTGAATFDSILVALSHPISLASSFSGTLSLTVANGLSASNANAGGAIPLSKAAFLSPNAYEPPLVSNPIPNSQILLTLSNPLSLTPAVSTAVPLSGGNPQLFLQVGQAAKTGITSPTQYVDVFDQSSGKNLLAITSPQSSNGLLVGYTAPYGIADDAAAPYLLPQPKGIQRIQTGPDSGVLLLSFSEPISFSLAPSTLLSQVGLGGSNDPTNGVLPGFINTSTGTLLNDSTSNGLSISNGYRADLLTGAGTGGLVFMNPMQPCGLSNCTYSAMPPENLSAASVYQPSVASVLAALVANPFLAQSTLVFDIGDFNFATQDGTSNGSSSGQNLQYLQGTSLNQVGFGAGLGTQLTDVPAPYGNAPIPAVANVAAPAPLQTTSILPFITSVWPIIQGGSRQKGSLVGFLMYANQPLVVFNSAGISQTLTNGDATALLGGDFSAQVAVSGNGQQQCPPFCGGGFANSYSFGKITVNASTVVATLQTPIPLDQIDLSIVPEVQYNEYATYYYNSGYGGYLGEPLCSGVISNDCLPASFGAQFMEIPLPGSGTNIFSPASNIQTFYYYYYGGADGYGDQLASDASNPGSDVPNTLQPSLPAGQTTQCFYGYAPVTTALLNLDSTNLAYQNVYYPGSGTGVPIPDPASVNGSGVSNDGWCQGSYSYGQKATTALSLVDAEAFIYDYWSQTGGNGNGQYPFSGGSDPYAFTASNSTGYCNDQGNSSQQGEGYEGYYCNQFAVIDIPIQQSVTSVLGGNSTSTGMFTQEIHGQVVSGSQPDGTAIKAGSANVLSVNVPGTTTARTVIPVNGAVVRADVVYFNSNNQITSAYATFSAAPGGNKATYTDVVVAFCSINSNDFGYSSAEAEGESESGYSSNNLLQRLNQESVAGNPTIPAYLNVYYNTDGTNNTSAGGQVSASLTDTPDSGGYCNPNRTGSENAGALSYPVAIKTIAAGATGTVTFNSPTSGNVTGSIVVAKTQPSLQYLCGDDITDSGQQLPHDPTIPCPLFALTDTYGNYSVNVGTSNVPSGTSPVVILSVFAPTAQASKAAWKMATYMDPSLVNYVPFIPDIGATTATATGTTNIPGGSTGGSNGKTVVNIMTDLIGHLDVQGVPNWQLVGVPGGMNRNTTKLSSFTAQTFLLAIKEKCYSGEDSPCNVGAPFSLWNYSASQRAAQNNGLGTVSEAQTGLCDGSNSNGSNCNDNGPDGGVNGVGNFNDEALVLAGGTVGVDFETNGGATNVPNIKATFVSGLGLALNQNDQGSAGFFCGTPWQDTYFDGANSSTPDIARVWYPLAVDSSGNPLKAPAAASLTGPGWSLITYNGSNYGDPSQLGCGGTPTGTSCTPVVDMVIQADDTGTSATWLSSTLGGTNNSVASAPGQTVNTLTSLTPGQPYFVHLSASASAFTFR